MKNKNSKPCSYFCGCIEKFKRAPAKFILPAAALVVCGLIIRLFSCPASTLWYILGGRGIFPSPFWYYIGFILRASAAGLLFSVCLFCRNECEIRLRYPVLSGAACILLLFEYRLIFCSFRPFIALVLTVGAGVLAFFAAFSTEKGSLCRSVTAGMFMLLQLIFAVQLISLCFCLYR